jgi:tripartite-type tricarboxylate transporter receptor subunit TctC
MTCRTHALLKWLLALAASAVTASVAAQVGYPARPIRLIIPFAPGAGTDATARAVATKLGESLGQTVVTENRPGAGGTVGLAIAAKAPADGYTIVIISPSHVVNVGLYANLPYDLLRDLTPITQLTTQPNVMVINPAIPATSVKAFIAWAKSRPDGVNYGSSGTGGISHLGGALFGSLTGLRLVHIPYKGGALATVDLIAGRTQMQMGSFLLNAAHIKAGRLRALAVTTQKRWPGAPDLPTMQEAGVPGFSITQWYGLLAPAKTPPAIVLKLRNEVARGLNQSDVKERLAADGAEVVGSSPSEFGAHIRTEVDKYAKVVKEIGLKPE